MFSNISGSLRRDRPAQGSGFALAPRLVIVLVACTGAARAQDCANESAVKSTQAGASVALSFRNASNERRRIYWLDQNGERKFYGVVEPQHILKQPTYAGHAWLVTDDAEKCLEIVTATDQAMTVDIGGGAVAQVTPPPPGAELAISQPGAGASSPPQPPEPEQAAVADQPPQVSPIEQFHLRGAYRLVPRDGPTKALNNESSGSVEITRVKPAWESGKWTFEEVPGTPYVRIKNDWKHTYLADRDGRLRTVKADDDDQDAHWSFEPVDGTDYVQLRNRKSERYLLTQDGDPKLAEHIPEKHENRSYWKVASATRTAAVEDERMDDAYAAAVADCREIGGYWTGSSCRARDRVRLTCPRGFVWSREDDECQWAGRDRCPPWQMHNGRCRADLTCRGGRVRLSGRGQSCQCPPGMVTWGHYPHLSCVPSVVRIVPLLLNNRGGHRQGNGSGNKQFGGAEGPRQRARQRHGNGHGKVNGQPAARAGRHRGIDHDRPEDRPQDDDHHRKRPENRRDHADGDDRRQERQGAVEVFGDVRCPTAAFRNSATARVRQERQRQERQTQAVDQERRTEAQAAECNADSKNCRAEGSKAEAAAAETAAAEAAAAEGAAAETAATEAAATEGAAAETAAAEAAAAERAAAEAAATETAAAESGNNRSAQQQKAAAAEAAATEGTAAEAAATESCSSRRRSSRSCSN